MDSSDEVCRLLEEIRDTQRDYLAEYKRVTQRSLLLQQQMSRLYRRVVGIGSVIFLGLLTFMAYISQTGRVPRF